MFKDISPAVIRKIKDIIEENDSCKINIEKSFQTYWLKSSNDSDGLETEFRISRLGNVQLLVSRVCFKNRRIGTMTAILRVLKDYCVAEDIKRIRIQSVETFEMMRFCNKNGMIPSSDNILIGNVLVGDYDLEITEKA